MKSIRLFRCLGDPTRLAVMHRLAEADELSVTDLIHLTGKEQTNVSHHLAQLRACGLVATRQDGRRICYRLAHPKLKAFLHEADLLADHVECTDAEACQEGGCC